jgi:DNA-binding PadR family transcriptional regulator
VTPVFSHGRLRLYLLQLLAGGPRHGYELIRLLENRFHGLYVPSAGTIYPRLARMEADGLITHTEAGGRKTYQITDAGRGELAARSAELDEIEAEIHSSVADLTALAEQVEAGVRGSVRDLKRELREARQEARSAPWRPWREPEATGGAAAPGETAGRPPGDAASTLVRRAAELAAEVTRLVAAGRASAEDLRVATTVLDSVRDQLRHILRG